MSDNTREMHAAVREILAAHSTQEIVVACEEDGWNRSLWQILVDGGYATISVGEDNGGSGGTVADACAVLHELGRASASVPFAEHALLAGWLMSTAGTALPGGITTVVEDSSGLQLESTDGEYRINGAARFVPWGTISDQVIAVIDNRAALIPSTAITWTAGKNVADEGRDTLTAQNAVPTAVWELPDGATEQVRLRGAFSRAALITGALERVMELTVRYTSEREQFGRPIARFQAIQRHIVRLAEMAQQASMATRVAALNAAEGLDFFDVASAKIVASECASTGSAAAHQSHGAIGMTKEYELGQLSRRLWSWRDEYGAERGWAIELGRRLDAAGADALWPRITEGLRADV